MAGGCVCGVDQFAVPVLVTPNKRSKASKAQRQGIKRGPESASASAIPQDVVRTTVNRHMIDDTLDERLPFKDLDKPCSHEEQGKKRGTVPQPCLNTSEFPVWRERHTTHCTWAGYHEKPGRERSTVPSRKTPQPYFIPEVTSVLTRQTFNRVDSLGELL